MPWYTDYNGQKYYLPSIWVKEELPTFREMWDFYQKKNFIYDPKIDTELDTYWKIPKQLYAIVTMCNQFNKMLSEDGWKDKVIKALSEDDVYMQEHDRQLPIIDVRAFLMTLPYNKDSSEETTTGDHPTPIASMEYIGDLDKNPIIYTIPFTNGKLNPFIRSSSAKRIDTRTLVDVWSMMMIGVFFSDLSIVGVLHNIPYKYDGPFEILMKEVREYYENGIGWKDEDGKPIQRDLIPNDNRKDPAL